MCLVFAPVSYHNIIPVDFRLRVASDFKFFFKIYYKILTMLLLEINMSVSNTFPGIIIRN